MKFTGDIPDWGAAIFHTDDSRFVLYACEYKLRGSERELRAIVARAGGNRFNPHISLILQGEYAQLDDIEHRHITGFLSAGHDHGAQPAFRSTTPNS